MSGSLGKIARYQNSEPALQNQRTGLLMVKPGNDRKFAKLVLKYVEPQIIAEGKGIAVQNVSAKEIEDCVFPLPPIDDQRRIVAEIEKQFTRLEVGVAALRRVQANLKRYRAAVLKAACEGRLVPTEAELQQSGSGVPPLDPDSTAKPPPSKDSAKVPANPKRQDAASTSTSTFESGQLLLARILTERRQNWQGRGKYKEPVKQDTAKLSPLPEGYTWASFGQICRVQGGFAFKSTDYVKEGVPLVRISNLVNGRVQVSQDTVFLPRDFASANPAFVLHKGDVLIAMSGATTGKMATMEEEIPALLNQRVGRFVLSSAKLSNAKFVSYLVMQITQKVLKDAYGAAQPNISPSEIEEMPIPLPPLAEQTRIVAEVERRLSVVEELEAVVTTNLQRATRLRQSILQKAFTGELAS
jgi:type I restriction enzyme S subunit